MSTLSKFYAANKCSAALIETISIVKYALNDAEVNSLALMVSLFLIVDNPITGSLSLEQSVIYR